jgi:hypothetical protein
VLARGGCLRVDGSYTIARAIVYYDESRVITRAGSSLCLLNIEDFLLNYMELQRYMEGLPGIQPVCKELIGEKPDLLRRLGETKGADHNPERVKAREHKRRGDTEL